ncbi:MAG: TIGR03936 family radical SAM-associated protein [Clostridia bacterium]|nr:TIGR03936 family radical SAM-associated protein [Clostridia bacterium]
MSNYVLKYKRGNEVKYISHLDFVRFIQRVIRRAELPMLFSSGFNPHPLINVALPLSVGVTADGELMKIGLDGDFDEKFVMDTINKTFPVGFEITKAKKVEGKEIDFTKINRAIYICECETEKDNKIDIDEFLKNEALLVMKKSKSGIKEADIKPHIHSIDVICNENNIITLKMCVDAGNNYNLKPDTVIDAMEKYIDGFKTTFFNVHRCALLADDKELL